VVEGKGSDGKRLSVDHIVPFRMAREIKQKYDPSLNPNDQKNLVSLCRGHHSRKTGIEARLLRGDVIGFRAEMRALIGDERTTVALRLFGLIKTSAA